MSALVLEGITLGQKHENYNILVNTASANEKLKLKSIDYDDNDIDNLFKIDVACLRQDVRYLIDILKCSDMFYVSYALRHSEWLFSDDHYAHIINPSYLHQELFPKMIKKAQNKLLHSIRLNLRNAKRVDEFFNYFKSNFEIAQKWLPHCSETLIISIVKEEGKKISVSIMHRLCRKSLAILKTCCETCPSDLWLKSGKSLLYTDIKEYLEILNSVEEMYIPQFGKKATRFLMDKYPEVIQENFHKYCYIIDIPEFAKHLKVKEIKTFLTKQLHSDRDKIRSWCKYKYMKHIVERIPMEERFQVVQELFLNSEKETIISDDKSEVNDETKENFYSWYRYVPFEIAIHKIKGTMIDLSSTNTIIDASIRPWAIRVLVTCAAGNMQHIQTLLRCYQEDHTKSIYDEHISLILVRVTKTYKYDETTWNMLNKIFLNMGIYDDRQIIDPTIYNYCIPAIILHNILHDQRIPEVIDKKISLDYFTNYHQKLAPEESDKVFTYLYKHVLRKLSNKEIENINDLVTLINICDDFLRFLKTWNKTIEKFPSVMDKIRELVKLIKDNSWSTDSLVCSAFTNLYRKHNSVKKQFFVDYLVLYQSDQTYLNTLKYYPDILIGDQTKIEMIIANDTRSLRRTLGKLRVYWPSSIVEPLTDLCFTRLLQTTNNKACIESLFILLPRRESLKLIEKYVPTVDKINWKEETSTIPFNIRKNICRCIHLLRPTASLDTVFLYTKGDYFRFTGSLFYDILLTTRYDQASTNILNFLVEPGGIQKLGIRYLLKNLEIEEVKRIILSVWNEACHSVKCGLFKHTYKLLIREEEQKMIEKIWDLLSLLFDNLTPKFYASVKTKADKFSKVPKLVKHKFYMKCFQYLKSHPLSKTRELFEEFFSYMRFNVEVFEISFMEEVLVDAIDNYLIDENYYTGNCRDDILRAFTGYLTINDSIESQQIKFEKMFLPVLKRFSTVWQDHREKFKKVLESLSLNVSKRLLKTQKYVVPTHLFKKIQTSITESFLLEKEYNITTLWNITVIFIELLEKFSNTEKFLSICETMDQGKYYRYQYECPEFGEIYSCIAPEFGKACLKYFVQENIISTYPFLWPLASKSMMDAFISLSFPYSVINQTLKHMLLDEDSTEIKACYLIVIGVVRYMYINSGNGEYYFSFDEELKNMILSHPSKVIRTHFRHCDLPTTDYFYEDTNSNWRRPGLMYQGGPNDSETY
ncbi:unnamed protein product [Diatraea saccharalis]|uniref:Uncharacterized protein n=1 Tax=Diatraea saccharalis TaxID=40085 RepID=A0A9N9R832_9NEOP|nr:unnamed protein product [Diatraea saccharalis]